MTTKLAGKVALITGGSRGIGAAIAERLAQEGAAVAFTYASAKQKAEALIDGIEAEGRRALAIRADNADVEEIKGAIAQTVRSFGRLDVLVNNAGIAIIKPIDEFPLDEFDRMVAVNVRAAFVASQEASRYMTEGGRIINIGSVNGDRIPFVGGSVYGMTKAAIAGLTRGLARDLGARKITVNNVQPGPIETDMNPSKGAFADAAKNMMALNRYGQVEEIAALVAFLASPVADFITGASLTIDGGYNA